MAEAYICVEVGYDFVTNWASLDAVMKYTLTDLTSNIAAMYAMNYDLSGYPSLTYAQTQLNVLWDLSQKMIQKLKDQDFTTFVTSG